MCVAGIPVFDDFQTSYSSDDYDVVSASDLFEM